MALSAHFAPLFGATWATLGDFWDHFGPMLAQKRDRKCAKGAPRDPRESQESSQERFCTQNEIKMESNMYLFSETSDFHEFAPHAKREHRF